MIQEGILSFLQAHPSKRYWLAYSGGLDSHVLLHACAALQQQVPQAKFQVIHIHHGLQTIADTWVTHAEQVCRQLKLDLKVMHLHLKPPAGESIEAVARQARYQAFQELLQEGEILLTAHHQNDQAETFLLNALRGSGGDGLAAMPALRVLGHGYLGRPLLAFERSQLEAYAHLYQLAFINDPSNDEINFDRNYLRHQVLPSIQTRWPAAIKTLGRAAQLQAEQRQLVEHLLAAELPKYQGSQVQTLSIKALKSQPKMLQKAILRYWLQSLGFALPSAKKLEHILQDVLQAAEDASPCVHWNSCELRRYRDDIYALAPIDSTATVQLVPWQDTESDLELPWLKRVLSKQLLSEPLLGFSLKPEDVVDIRFRQGGERIQRVQGYALELKTVLQDTAIPPWQRGRIPLIYINGQLRIAVGVYPQHPLNHLLQSGA